MLDYQMSKPKNKLRNLNINQETKNRIQSISQNLTEGSGT